MQVTLHQPVSYDGVRLAPTTELAGLAELAAMSDDDERLHTLVRVARALAAEDHERARIADRRVAGLSTPLPRRR